MKIKIEKQDEIVESKHLVAYIGYERYRISESIDGKLRVNKTSDGDSDLISVHPRSGNEIELS